MCFCFTHKIKFCCFISVFRLMLCHLFYFAPGFPCEDKRNVKWNLVWWWGPVCGMEALMEEETRANILLSRHPPQGLAGKVALREQGWGRRRGHGEEQPVQPWADQTGHQGERGRTWSAAPGSWCSGHRATCRAGGTSGAAAGTSGAAPGYCQWSCPSGADQEEGRRGQGLRVEAGRHRRSLLWTWS